MGPGRTHGERRRGTCAAPAVLDHVSESGRPGSWGLAGEEQAQAGGRGAVSPWLVTAALLSQSLPPRPPVWQMGRPRPQAGPLPS